MVLHIGASVYLTSEEVAAVRYYTKAKDDEAARECVRRVAASSGRIGAQEFVDACVDMHSIAERRSTPRTESVAAAFSEIPRSDPGAW